MAKLSDIQIRGWIKSGERFEQRSDGDGLYLRFREKDASPSWLFRYRFAGKQRLMVIGRYGSLSLADARKEARRLAAQVSMGADVAGDKQARKAAALAKIEADEQAMTVADLADEFFERTIVPRWKHPQIVRSKIERDIKPVLGKKKVEEVKPADIDALLKAVVDRGAPTVANDVLRWVRRMFNYAIKRHLCEYNPAAAFDQSDAGGAEPSRDRALDKDEIKVFFRAMRKAKGFSVQNELTIKLLLLLAVRKQELTAARWDEFDLDSAVWNLPAARTKTGAAIAIPLPPVAVDWLRDLQRLSCGSDYVLPARKAQTRMLPHIHEGTINVALAKVKHGLKPFTVHDLRRTARTRIAGLQISDFVAERCLNHAIPGSAGKYDRFHYFDERRDALTKWAGLLESLMEEVGD